MISFDRELIKLTKHLSANLLSQNISIVTAESCTGGSVAALFTELAGSSSWFDRGFVTYSNLSKVEMVGVNPKTLTSFGAASEQTASEMATGALQHSQADVSLAITGIAGPSGGSNQKPVGLVCFAWSGWSNQETTTQTLIFSGNRAAIRSQSILHSIKQAVVLSTPK